ASADHEISAGQVPAFGDLLQEFRASLAVALGVPAEQLTRGEHELHVVVVWPPFESRGQINGGILPLAEPRVSYAPWKVNIGIISELWQQCLDLIQVCNRFAPLHQFEVSMAMVQIGYGVHRY